MDRCPHLTEEESGPDIFPDCPHLSLLTSPELCCVRLLPETPLPEPSAWGSLGPPSWPGSLPPCDSPQHCCRSQQCVFLSLHPQGPGMKEFRTRGSQIPEHTLGWYVSWGSDSDPNTLACHTSRRAPLHLFLTYPAARSDSCPDFPPQGSPHPQALCTPMPFLGTFLGSLMLAPTFSNKEPHLGIF